MSIQQLNEGDFVSLVGEELSIFEQMLTLARQKFDALTHGKVGHLSGIVENEEKLIRRLSGLEARRAVFLAGALPLLSLKEGTLTALARKFSPEHHAKLMEMKDRWQQILFELHELHLKNHRLLESAMKLLEVRLKAFRMTVQDFRYSRRGERLLLQGSLLLNRRA